MRFPDSDRATRLAVADLLEIVCSKASLPYTLEMIVLAMEDLSPGTIASILLVESGRIRFGAAPHLPPAYNEAIDGLEIGPVVGSCGTAAYRGEPVIVGDIATDPLWENYRDLAETHGLRACWSTPIKNADGAVIATFAVYYNEPRSPTADDFQYIARATHIAQIAIERKGEEEALRTSEARFRSLVEHCGDGVFFADAAGYFRDVNGTGCEMLGYTSEEILSMHGSEVIVPEQIHRVDSEIEEVLRGVPYLREWTFRRKDGTTFPGEMKGRRLPDGSMVGILRDITERKRAEQKEDELNQIQGDLETARQIHARTMPGRLPHLAGATIGLHYLPLQAVGGDLYDFFQIEDSRLGVLIADVMGHGLAAALDAASVRIAFKDAVSQTHEPAEIMSLMNGFLFRHLDRRFVTASYTEIDTKRMILRGCCAGHPPGLLARAATNEVLELRADGMLLGVEPDPLYIMAEEKLEDSDAIYLFTDGLYESYSATNFEDVWPRFKDCIKRQAVRRTDGDDALLADLNRLRNFAQTDDITFLSVRIEQGVGGAGTHGAL